MVELPLAGPGREKVALYALIWACGDVVLWGRFLEVSAWEN